MKYPYKLDLDDMRKYLLRGGDALRYLEQMKINREKETFERAQRAERIRLGEQERIRARRELTNTTLDRFGAGA